MTANCPNGHRFRVMIVEKVADGDFAYRLTGGLIEGEPNAPDSA